MKDSVNVLVLDIARVLCDSPVEDFPLEDNTEATMSSVMADALVAVVAVAGILPNILRCAPS